MSVPLLEEESRSLSATANLGGLTEKISVARLYEQGRRLLLKIIDLLLKLKVCFSDQPRPSRSCIPYKSP
ncbi:hypothetical protein YC2023_113749 [Brassica napus]